MGQNNLPHGQDDLFTLAGDMADGLEKYGAPIGVVHNPETTIRAALAAAHQAENDYQTAAAGLRTARTAVVVATSNGRAWATLARDIWKPALGSRFNAAWKPAGFDGSIAIPSKPEEVHSLLANMKTFLENNPSSVIKTEKINVSPEQAEILRAALEQARNAFKDQDTQTTGAHDFREARMDALRGRLSACIREVGDMLDDLDPRWIALGLNRPGDPDRPDAPEHLRLEPAGPGQLRAVCDPAPRAEHYRWYRKVEGVDADFVPLPTTQDPQTILDGLPGGATVLVHVSAGNQGGDSAPTADATQKVL